MEQIRISGKKLGELALANFCPRCFWIKMHCDKLPYQIFPGIFSSIDSYSKKITNLHFERHTKLPEWFNVFGILGNPVKVPHHSKFFVVDSDTKVLLTGDPDEIFCKSDKSYFIADYKTAKFTDKQDELLPMYEVQLNSYAYIGERTGFRPISGLGLIYYEPVTDISHTTIDSFVVKNGFAMHFSGHFLAIEVKTDMIPSLLHKVREICQLSEAPEGTASCQNCSSLEQLLNIAKVGGIVK